MTDRLDSFRGNFIGGRFVRPQGGRAFRSSDPARAGTPVFEAIGDPSAVDAAVEAAAKALPAWRRRTQEERNVVLRQVVDALPGHLPGLAQAISREMGKVISESRGEAASVGGKITGLIDILPHELAPAPPAAPGEQRFHALGVVGVIGPFNFPVHLLNTHIIPALLTGNTVVAKPSEVTPLAGQRYAELFEAAGLPEGVFNVVHGQGDVGAALAGHDGLRGLVFTGSYPTGRRIREATFDQPNKKVCLELGGKNPAVVLDDADLDHAVREILLGALLTTGQRCTATSRVIATAGIAGPLRDRLVDALRAIEPGPPDDESSFMGPLATRASRERFEALVQQARDEGAQVLVESRSLQGGWYVTPGMCEVVGHEKVLREELFGPHIAFEVASSEADAFARAASNPYGLSASLFAADPEAFERFYDVVPAGVLNFNRSTNGASGLLPFGGVGMSGNFHPAGSVSLRGSTYPVAVMSGDPGQPTANDALDRLLGGSR